MGQKMMKMMQKDDKKKKKKLKAKFIRRIYAKTRPFSNEPIWKNTDVLFIG